MRKALFLDRDGVINVEKNYVFRINDFEFVDGIFEICAQYQRDDYLIFVVTNQAGIARGIFSENDFMILTDWMLQQFKEKGINITQVYHCPHHPDYTGTCFCRKPNPGMFIKAAIEYYIDLKASVVIGDKESDLRAGRNAGIESCYYIQSLLV